MDLFKEFVSFFVCIFREDFLVIIVIFILLEGELGGNRGILNVGVLMSLSWRDVNCW